MDEVLGAENFVLQITYKVTSGFARTVGPRRIEDYIIWYAKNKKMCKFHRIYKEKNIESLDLALYKYKENDGSVSTLTPRERRESGHLETEIDLFRTIPLHTMGTTKREIRQFQGEFYSPPANTQWRHTESMFNALVRSGRVMKEGNRIGSKLYMSDFPYEEFNSVWLDTGPEVSKLYAVQTSAKVIARCMLMTTDPGDLVLDPTCGAGTTAHVAEQWGRRWITIDTSRVALALARARIMGARYPYYLLLDSLDGQRKEAELTGRMPSKMPTYENIRQGFVYRRVPRITLKSIADNTESNIIWEEFQQFLDPLREQLNRSLGKTWEEWEIPRATDNDWPNSAKLLHARWWDKKNARQKEIDASISAKAEHEYLYDDPYEDSRKVRVAGPFTVESTSPHRVPVVDERDEIANSTGDPAHDANEHHDFTKIILDNLGVAGVQQADKKDKIDFISLTPWPGYRVCAEGTYREEGLDEGTALRAAIFVGPEFGTVSRSDLVSAAREAAEGGFDVLISCAFNYDARSTQLEKLGRIPILKARMNTDLYMADTLKTTGEGNLFVIFGEPDIDIVDAGNGQIQIKVNGIDVFVPNTGEIRSDGPEGIACWFIDTDYNEESFFVRHAYFLGTGTPYKSLRTTLKAEIDAEVWASVHSNISKSFNKPQSGRVAVKVINHLGDEVMKVFNMN